MMDSLTITILAIVIITFLSAFIKGRSRDRCLKKMDGYLIKIYNSKEKIIEGIAEIESNSIIVDLVDEQKSKKFIVYKNEFKNMEMISRPFGNFDKSQVQERDKVLKKVLKPGPFSKLKRKFGNFFATAKDAINEILNLFLASFKTMGPMKTISNSSNQLDKLKGDTLGAINGNSFEPIWEKYIGRNVEVEVLSDENFKISGLLGEYSQAYIFLFNATIAEPIESESVDLIINRSYGTVRHVI